MKLRLRSSFPILPLLIALSGPVLAQTLTKDNNTTNLNLAGSWVGGTVVPGSGNTLLWNNTLPGTNSSALGGNLSVLGLQVTNPGGAITVPHATGNVLTIGSGGIDMSTASQNLTLLSSAATGDIAIGANQAWNINTGRTLTLFGGSNTLNQRLTGSGNIEKTGGGTVVLNTGDFTSTGAALDSNGNDTFTGNWTITAGQVRAQRNGTHAWGRGTIYLNGGTIGAMNGNWMWSNNIVLNSSTSSFFDDFNGSGTTRTLKLTGEISGSGNVTFNDSNSRSGNDTGYILTGTNTLSGTVTLGTGADVRVGGVATAGDLTTTSGTGGTLGTASVNLSSATSVLTISRSDNYTFANTVSGSGVLRIGVSTAAQNTGITTVSGNNSHSGGTRIQSAATLNIGHASALGSGPIILSANGNLDNGLGSPLTVANELQLSGGSLTFVGTNNMTINGAVTLGVSNRTITATAGTLTLGGNISGAFNLTKDGAGTLVLNGTGSHNATNINAGTLVLGNSTNTLPDAQAVTVNGGILSIGANNDTVGAVTLTTGSITGSTGTLTGSSYAVSAGTISAILGGTGGLTKSTTGTVTLSGANTYNGGTAVNAGILVFANKAARSASTSVTTLAAGTVGLGVHDSDTAYYNASDVASIFGATLTGFTLDPASAVAVDTTNAGASFNQNSALTGSRSLIKIGTGTLSLTTANTYTGSTTVQSGSLQLSGGDNRLATAGSVVLGTGTSSGTLVLDGISQTLASLTTSGSGTANAVVGGNATASTLTLDFASGTVTYAGKLGGTGTNENNLGLAKSGDGTLALSGANTYTGATTVNAGTLSLTGSLTGSSISTTGTGIINQSGAGLIAGTGVTFTQGSSGTSVLSGNNSFTGGTTLDAGTLQVGHANALGTGALTINGGTLTSGSTQLSLANNITLDGNIILTGTAGTQGMRLNGVISGTGGLTKEGTGRFTIVNDSDVTPNTFSGSTTVNAGILAVSLKALSSSSSVHVAGTTDGGLAIGSNGTTLINNLTGTANGRIRSDFNVVNDGVRGLQINQTVDGEFAGTFVQGGGGRTITLTKTGTAALTLSGGGGYTGGTILSQGSIIATSSGALGSSGTITINDANTGSNNTTLNINATGAAVTIARAITVANEGTGTVTLGSATTSGTNAAIFSGAITLARDVTLNGGTAGDRFSTTGGISGTGNVTIAGTNRVLFVGAANTYNGTTTISANSILQLSDGVSTATSFIPDASVVNTGAGSLLKLAKGSNNETIGGLTGTGTIRGHEGVAGAASVLTINTTGSHSFGGVLEDGGASGSTLSLVKDGSGTQILTGTNTYTGTTSVNAGTLVINGNISTSTTTVQSGATIGGSGTVGALSVLAGGILAPGTSPGTLGTGTLTLADTSISAFELNPSDTTVGLNINDLVAVTGSLTLDGILNVVATSGDFLSVIEGTSWRLFNYSGSLTDNTLTLGTMPALGTGLGWSVNTATAGQVNLVVVPEPAAALLGGLGLLCLLRRRR